MISFTSVIYAQNNDVFSNVKEMSHTFDGKVQVKKYLEANLIFPYKTLEYLKDIELENDCLIVVEIGGYETTQYSFLVYRGDSLPRLYYDNNTDSIKRISQKAEVLNNIILNDILIDKTKFNKEKYRHKRVLTAKADANILIAIRNNRKYEFHQIKISNVGYPSDAKNSDR